MSKLPSPIADYHGKKLAQLGYPTSTYSEQTIIDLGHSIEFAGIFKTPKKMPHLPWTQVQSPTLVGKSDHTTAKKLQTQLIKRQECHVILIESYNEPMLELKKLLELEPTEFSNSKLVFGLDQNKTSPAPSIEDLNIRTFNEKTDKDLYVELYNRSLGHLGSIIDLEFLEQEILHRETFNPEGYFIAELEDKAVGIMSIELLSPEICYIFQCGITPQAKGRGIASCLHQHALRFASSNGAKRIWVSVSNSNKEAHSFFRRMSFREAFQITGYLIR